MCPSKVILGSSLQLCTETFRALDSFVAVFEFNQSDGATPWYSYRPGSLKLG